MIKVIDIQNHISLALKAKFPTYPVYADGNRKDMDRPAFHSSVRPLLTTGAMRYKSKVVNVDISYLSKKGTKAENLEMMERLEDIFHLGLKVYDRTLYIQDLSISEVDTVLTVRFTLDYNVQLKQISDFEVMRELKIAKGED